MTPLQIILIIIFVILLVTGIITYSVRGKYYDKIDELDRKKKEVIDQAPLDELEEVRRLSITGQSSELRDEFETQWDEIESVKYPKLENYLFEAEQASDRYRLKESKKHQENAEEMVQRLENETNELTKSLKELIEREQANLKKIDAIKKRYHEVRKSLLSYSFSFGPASESFEEKLNSMEEDFTKFSEYTLSGDHEEANKIIEDLSHYIEETEEEMDQIPPLLAKIDEEYQKDIEDLNEGYGQMVDYDYLFPEDNLLDKIRELEEKKNQALESIRLLEIEQANSYMKQMADEIDHLYDKMELELESEAKVYPLIKKTKEALYFLADEMKHLVTLEQRLKQSYILFHEETKKIDSMGKEIKEANKEYEIISEKIHESEMPYSTAYNRLKYLFEKLNRLNDEQNQLTKILNNYRKEELNYQDKMLAMEEAMYDMKRALENERLPGLPDNYLELFFSATRRIEKLSEELSHIKVSLLAVRKRYEIAEEDVIQLSQMTEEIIDEVNLIERVSQRLYHYKEEHKGILETIRYSESLFKDEYDYNTSLRLLKEKLENVAPGIYKDIVEEYEKGKKNQSF